MCACCATLFAGCACLMCCTGGIAAIGMGGLFMGVFGFAMVGLVGYGIQAAVSSSSSSGGGGCGSSGSTTATIEKMNMEWNLKMKTKKNKF